jgi:hypothetical protein
MAVVGVAVRDLLERFRPAGAPGAATPAGVPSDRAAALSDELGPVLALLADVEEECARIRREGDELAARVRADAAARAAATLAGGRDRAEAARAEVVELQHRRSKADAERELSHAHRTIATIERTSRAGIPDLVDRVVDAVRADLLGAADAVTADEVRP